jgi:hypothetical protein
LRWNGEKSLQGQCFCQHAGDKVLTTCGEVLTDEALASLEYTGDEGVNSTSTVMLAGQEALTSTQYIGYKAHVSAVHAGSEPLAPSQHAGHHVQWQGEDNGGVLLC